MLKHITTRLKHTLILLLAVPALALAATQPLDRIAVIVNDDIIMQSQVQQAINNSIAKLQQSDTPMPSREVLLTQVLEGLIMESLQLQIAERAGIRIDDTSLNEAMKRIAAQNNMTLPEFQQAVAAQGADYAAMREQIRRELLTTRARQGSVGPRIQITEQEVDNFLASAEGQQLQETRYRIGHILIKAPTSAPQATRNKAAELARALRQKLQAGADFAALARQHSAGPNAPQGGDMGWRSGQQLPSLFKEAVPALTVGEVSAPIRSGNGFHLVKLLDKRGGSEVLQAQTKVRHILIQPSEIRSEQQTEALIRKLHQRLQAGESFAELARLYSDDPGSRAKGGDLGWITPDALVPAFSEVMQDTPVDTVSEPFQSRYGWHILEVEGRRQQNIGREAIRNQAREALYKRKFNEELQLWLREIRDNAFVDIKI